MRKGGKSILLTDYLTYVIVLGEIVTLISELFPNIHPDW